MRPFVKSLHNDLVTEFDPLRKLGVKFNFKILRNLALSMIETSEILEYFKDMEDTVSGLKIGDMVTPLWAQAFAQRFKIVSRALTEKLLLSPAKEKFIEKEVAYHLGQMAREFRTKGIDGNDIANADETHFLIDVDHWKTLGFSGEPCVKYADVLSGGKRMTLVVPLSGGKDAKIEASLWFFKTHLAVIPYAEFLIIYKACLIEVARSAGWTGEYCQNGCERNEQFTWKETHFPADSFVVQKIKQAWSTRWEAHRMPLIQENGWRERSGKLNNPGMEFFLRLSAWVVRDVNRQRDENRLSYDRKATIRTGLALNINGQWEEGLPFPQQQEIIKKHHSHFEGQPPIEIETSEASGDNLNLPSIFLQHF